MRKLAVILSGAALASLVLTAAEVEQRIIKTEGGQIALAVPKGWPALETRFSSRGAQYYRFAPADTNFEFLLYFNYPSPRRPNVLADNGLEAFLESSLSTLAKGSKVEPHRFGARKDVVYAWFTHQAAKPGDYYYFTRGIRLIGTNVLEFSLFSNDSSAMSNTLAVVESVKVWGGGNEKKN
jgi:hypothetical protein